MTRNVIKFFNHSYLVIIILFISSCAQSIYQRKLDKVAPTAEEVSPVLPGFLAPDAIIKNTDGKDIQLHSVLNEKKTVLIFYRGGWCPYCVRQLQRLRKIESQLRDLGYQLIALSSDSAEKIKESLKRHRIDYQLFSDSKVNAAKAFGVAFRVDPKTNLKYLTFGINLSKASGEDHHVLPVPAVFLIDKKRTIQFMYINPNYKVRLNEKVLLEAAKAIN